MTHFQIIGGGIAGASIAYHLAKNEQKVTVYDRHDQGQATSASAGIICPWTSQRRNKAWYRLVKAGAKYYPTFIKELEGLTGHSTGYQQNGALSLFKDSHIQGLAYERIMNKAAEALEMGQVKKLSADELRTLHPYLTTHFPAVYVEGGAQVSGNMLLETLKLAIKKLGGEWIATDQAPKELLGKVIYTAGAWANEYAEDANVRHQRAELLDIKVNTNINRSDIPVVMGLGPMYIVNNGNQHFYIGTTHEDTVQFDTSENEVNRDYLLTQANRYFTKHTIEKCYSSIGMRPLTDENLPFIGPVNGVYVVNGLGSSGLTAGPVIGREVARFLLGLETTLNLTDYNHLA